VSDTGTIKLPNVEPENEQSVGDQSLSEFFLLLNDYNLKNIEPLANWYDQAKTDCASWQSDYDIDWSIPLFQPSSTNEPALHMRDEAVHAES